MLIRQIEGTFQAQQRIPLGDVNPRAVKVIDVDKNKGIRYVGERLKKKVGKTGVK